MALDLTTVYTGEQTQAQIDADATIRLARNSDFKGGLAYKLKDRVGVTTAGVEIFVLRNLTVDANDFTREAFEFAALIRDKKAYVAV